MKDTYQAMASALEIGLKERPSGMGLFAKEMFSTNARAFAEDTKTVYLSGYAFPAELLWAFDIVPFDFEIACNNLPEVGGGKGSSLMVHAENEGYSPTICSFDRLIIGCMSQNILPEGDLFLTSSYYCQGKAKTNEIVARHFGKESVLFDVPHEISPSSIRYVTTQLKDIASKLEEATGESFDIDRLRESIRRSNQARSSQLEINELMKSKPCPWKGENNCLLGLGGAVFWGSAVREEINQSILRDIKQRMSKKEQRQEDHRILWFPWVPVQATNIYSTLKQFNTSIVMAEAAIVWWEELDDKNPFEALALKALHDPHVGGAERRIPNLLSHAAEYDVDGAIHFSTPSCYHENGSLQIIGNALREKGIPLLNLEGDMSDERNYSPEQTMNKLSSFLEMLGL